MAPESWLVVTVAAAFLLLGIAASPLAWVALLHRRSRIGATERAAIPRTDWPVARAGRPAANGASPRCGPFGGAVRRSARADVPPRLDPRGRRRGWSTGRWSRAARRSPGRAQADRRPESGIGDERSRGHAQRAEPALRRHLGPGGYRGIARRHRPGDRSADRPDRADPGTAAADRRSPDHASPMPTRMIPIRLLAAIPSGRPVCERTRSAVLNVLVGGGADDRRRRLAAPRAGRGAGPPEAATACHDVLLAA